MWCNLELVTLNSKNHGNKKGVLESFCSGILVSISASV